MLLIFRCDGLSNMATKFLFSRFDHSRANDQTVKRDYDCFLSAFCILLPKVFRAGLQPDLYTYVNASWPERRLTDDDRRAGVRITPSSMMQCWEHKPAYAHGQQTPCRWTCNMTQGHATSCTYRLKKKKKSSIDVRYVQHMHQQSDACGCARADCGHVRTCACRDKLCRLDISIHTGIRCAR